MKRGLISLTRPLHPDLRTQRAAAAYTRADRVVADTAEAVRLASSGLRVVLESEDPDEEALLGSGVPLELLPGLHPAQEKAHLLGLGSRSPLLLVSRRVESWDALLETRGTLLISEGLAARDELLEAGLPSTHELLEFEGQLAVAPAHGLAGWRERLPLHGKRIVVTRERSKARQLSLDLEELGAHPLICPVLRFEPPSEFGPLDRAIDELEQYRWLVFTSPNGVRFFFSRLRERDRDLRALGACRLACIGPSTARCLSEHGLKADLVPQEFVAEGLLEAFAPFPLEGARMLLPRAAEAREVLPETLRSRGAEVDVVPCYRTVPPQDTPPELLQADLVSFTSSSTVRHFHALTGLVLPAAVIGPVTGKTARELGYPVVAQAQRYTVEGLVEALLTWAQEKRPA